MSDWLYVAKRQGKSEFIKAFVRFDPARVDWTTNVAEAAELTEAEWQAEGAMKFICTERLCLVSARATYRVLLTDNKKNRAASDLTQRDLKC